MNLKNNYYQRGAALLTSLVLVFVIAILGTAIGKQVFTLSKMSTSNYDQIMSFSNADSAVNEGGAVILENAYTSSAVLTVGESTAVVVDEFSSPTWWSIATNWSGAIPLVDTSSNALEGNPKYIIEDTGTVVSNLDMATSVASRHFYRVTSKANGKGDAAVYIQANYAIWE